ncbi:MAG: ankyrin repeat domain-containing protein [Alphaproteobacteria bacterium]|nr:ankyrin repeat domain-containing protein [Alphaproteobacteria bacterium]
MKALPRLFPLAVIALLITDIQPAAAQFAAPPGQPGARQQRPPALPGLAARRAPDPIPADESANLSPTPALFDAITRGDLAAARDAVNRGADLNGRNALGLTPTDWAVDQGRNDILFYLLSARGMAGSSGPSNARSAAAARAEQERAERAAQQEALRLSRLGPRAPSVSIKPRLFANDGGAAQLEAGFLGFDAGRPGAARRGG